MAASDKTYGFKVSEDTYNRAKMTVETSGMTGKEWLEYALALYESNQLQTNAPEYSNSLNELQIHTTRIYELVVNMVQQSIYLKDDAIKTITQQLENKEFLLNDLQEKLRLTKEELSNSTNIQQEQLSKINELLKQAEENRKTLENSHLLVAEYKEKNDSLAGLVAKYQSFADENEKLKAEYNKQIQELTKSSQEELQAANTALLTTQDKVKFLESITLDLEKQVTEITTKAKQDLELQQERYELATEKALVKVEREYQAKLQAYMDQANERIIALQNENERIRENYEKRINTLMNQNKKANPNKATTQKKDTHNK